MAEANNDDNAQQAGGAGAEQLQPAVQAAQANDAAPDRFEMVLQLMQLQEARQAATEAAALVREQAALVREAQAQTEASVAQLSKPANKEVAKFLTAVSMTQHDKDRMTLTSAAIEQMRMAELEDTLEDRHANLKLKIKQLKALSTDAQDILFHQLKATKRKPEHGAASAASGSGMSVGCSVCGRPNHTADRCYAVTNAAGDSIGANKRPRQNFNGSISQRDANMLFGFNPQQAQMAQYAQMQQLQQQQQMQQFAMPPPMAPAAGAGAPQNPANFVCFNCGASGHKSFNCPIPRRAPGALAAAAAAAGAAAGAAAAGGPRAPIVVSQQTCAQPAVVCVNEDHEMVGIQMIADSHSRSVIVPCPLVCVNNAIGIDNKIHSGSLICSPDVTSHKIEMECDSEEESKINTIPLFINDHLIHDRDDSEASTYACWDVEDSNENEEDPESLIGISESDREKEKKQQHHSCIAEIYSSNLEGTRADTKNILSNSNFVPILSSKCETSRSLAQLALQGKPLMPAHVQSLRAAMGMEFNSKKKVLSDEVSQLQLCDRCNKKGHTAFSCPDQTQREEEDKSSADTWVRQLINLPRVDVLHENAGLSLEEGVAKWKAKGAELNRGNPWEGSNKMEDSLKKQLGYHKAMGMSSVHLGWIGFGIPLQFIEERHPRPLAFRNHPSAMEEQTFVDAEHASNVKDGSFVKVPRSMLKGICPLQVVKHPVSGKRRLVQDLRWINGHLPNVKFRMESLHTELGDVVQPADKMLTTDIAKAYYCLALHPDAQPYLGWEWKGEFYMPTCLVFGLASAPRIFTKIMRPMMAFMRSLKVRVLGMIDDYLWAAKANGILTLREAVRTVFPLLGWSFNAKCEWEPADEVLMLGMLVNAAKFEVRAPVKKIQTTLTNIHSILMKQRATPQRPVSIKDIQRVTGRLMSMMLALPGVRVFTRNLYQCLAIALEGNETRQRMGMTQPFVWTLQLTRAAVEELEFWQTRLLTHNRLEISCRENQVQMMLWSDASDVGWGGEAAGVETQLLKSNLPTGPINGMASGALPFVEIQRSSTRRELIALIKVASSPQILEQIRGKRIRVLMDSQPAIANLLKGGGPVPELCEAVREWVEFCEKERIQPVYEWVERARNWRADEASKLHSQQHTWKKASIETELRHQMNAIPATQWRSRTNHFKCGVPIFLPMFHQIDARVEMIRSQLEEAIIVVPRWPAGGVNDWWRRVEHHSIARIKIGKVSGVYAERPQTGHDDELEAFWIMGRRGEKNRKATESNESKL